MYPANWVHIYIYIRIYNANWVNMYPVSIIVLLWSFSSGVFYFSLTRTATNESKWGRVTFHSFSVVLYRFCLTDGVKSTTISAIPTSPHPQIHAGAHSLYRWAGTHYSKVKGTTTVLYDQNGGFKFSFVYFTRTYAALHNKDLILSNTFISYKIKFIIHLK